METAKAGVDFCSYCNVTPRNPCRNHEEAADCPNLEPESRDYHRSHLPGYPQDKMDELKTYREKYGKL